MNPPGGPDNPRPKQPCDADDALAVLKRLRQAGHESYFAGGCVRDTLLGRKPTDWDVATAALPQQVQQLFTSTQAVGAAFGVVLVRHGKSVVEVATFRSDGPYEDGRRPASVRFTTAQEDAQRRDFTINGLFLDPVENRVIDYVGGRADLEAKQLRAIGIPSDRFAEDHLRLLRAVRFAARFAFQVEAATAEAIRVSAPQLRGISPERVGDELRLMLTPTTRSAAWHLLWELELAPVIFRFLPKAPAKMDMNHSLFLRTAPSTAVPFGLAVAAATLCAVLRAEGGIDVRQLLSRSRVSGMVRAMRQSLRLSNEESDEMSHTLTGIEPLLADAPPRVAIKKRFLALRTSTLSRQLMEAMAKVGLQRERIGMLRPQLVELAEGEVAPTPLVSGDDLTAAGYSPGPEFKRVLDLVYDAQLESRIVSKDEAMEMARRLFGK